MPQSSKDNSQNWFVIPVHGDAVDLNTISGVYAKKARNFGSLGGLRAELWLDIGRERPRVQTWAYDSFATVRAIRSAILRQIGVEIAGEDELEGSATPVELGLVGPSGSSAC